MLFFSVIYLIIGKGNIFHIILYVNFLRIKYLLNANLKLSFSEIHDDLEGPIKKRTPSIIYKVVFAKLI